MLAVRRSIFSKLAVAWSRAKPWTHPLASFQLAAHLHMRKYAAKSDLIRGIPVYVFPSKHDLAKGLSLLQGSIDLIYEKSPGLIPNFRRVFKSIIIEDFGPRFDYCCPDRCLEMNVLAAFPETKTDLAIFMISYAWWAILTQGRFGYIGYQGRDILVTRSLIRFAQRCICRENHLFLLRMLSRWNQKMDKLRPGRRYYDRFLSEDFGKVEFWESADVGPKRRADN
jgi:hypothetical protein